MVDNPFGNAPTVPTRLSGAPAPLSVEQAKTDISKAPTPGSGGTSGGLGIKAPEKEDPLRYVQRILAEHDGLESNIPVFHDYWEMKRKIPK